MKKKTYKFNLGDVVKHSAQSPTTNKYIVVARAFFETDYGFEETYMVSHRCNFTDTIKRTLVCSCELQIIQDKPIQLG